MPLLVKLTTDHTHSYIDHTHHFPCRNSLEQVGVIGCGLVEAVVHFVPATTAELETLEDGEEQPHNYQKLHSTQYHMTLLINHMTPLINHMTPHSNHMIPLINHMTPTHQSRDHIDQSNDHTHRDVLLWKQVQVLLVLQVLASGNELPLIVHGVHHVQLGMVLNTITQE